MSDVKPVAKNTFTIEEMQVELDDDANKIKALQAEIEALRKDAEKKDNLLQECRGHLKGWKMSMLASTPERLLAKIDAAIAKEKQP